MSGGPVVHPEAPDGGWGWMVVLAAFFQSALVFGVIRSFGVFFVEFVGYFGELAGRVSWITSIGIAVQQFASFRVIRSFGVFFVEFMAYFRALSGRVSWVMWLTIASLLFSSPVGSALSTQYGARPVVMAGGFLSGLGMLLASFATSLTHLYLSIGLLSGFGWALVFTPSVASVARYFKRRRTFATGLAFTGVGLASFAFSPLFQLLVDTYAWRGALLVVAGITFNLVVCGALIRPLTLKEDLAGPVDPGGSCLRRLATLFSLPLLAHWPFMRFVLAVTLINTGYFIPYVHLVARAQELGFDEYQAAFLMSVAAMADLCGRLLSGWLADCRAFRLVHSLVAWTSLTGISLALVPLGRSYPLLMAIGVCYGFFSGALTPVVFSILPEIVGIGRIFGSLGLLQMMESIGGLLGAPFSGWLRDMTGDYTASFLAAGAFLLAGSLVLVTLPNFSSCLDSFSPACQGAKAEAGAEPATSALASGELSSQHRDWPARSQDLTEPA